ncbi:hypothetical protein [Burkholderia cepacia]|uniref:Uncharacterized protein n=1 Tax=Burkholderia cepacia GG4 TaxID=1009846 RepID=A0A9W3JZ19_BURCE|nr:hypothetical protein [Burkholderia cepacia]AFQ46488.1 hypothetical protein GEM_0027 [Burkholderia cepacia GG4]
MRDLNLTECKSVSGGAISASAIVDFINNLMKPPSGKLEKPWESPMPAPGGQTGVVESIGKGIVAVGIAIVGSIFAIGRLFGTR